MKGIQYISEMLKAYGVTHIFYQDTALPGFLTAAYQAGIKLVVCKSEEAAGYMADGYARASNRPGFTVAQSIGSANLAAGLHDAWLAGSPVIAMTNKKSCKWQYRNSYQESDHRNLFSAICRFNAFCDDPQELPRILNQAFREVVTSKPRPAYIDIDGFLINTPIDTANLPDEVNINKSFASYPAFRFGAEEKFVKEAAAAINAAAKPILIVGRGAVISGADEEIYAFASRGDIPVVTTPDGKTIIDEADPLWAGVVGDYGMKATNQIVSEADLVIYIGSGTNDQTTLDWISPKPLTKVVQIDIDPTELGRSFVNTIPLYADAKLGTAQLTAAIDKKNRSEWRAFTSSKIAAHVAQMDEQAAAVDVLGPARVCYEVAKALPEDAILVSDTGYSAIWTGNYVRVKPGQFYTRAAGSLGWSYPASLGVKCGAPSKPVVCFTGDGGFFYHSNEMETAMRRGINTVTVLNNNGGLNQCGPFHHKLKNDDKAAYEFYKFTEVDYGKLAAAYGVWHKKITAPDKVGPAIHEAMECGKPALVECVTSPDCHPLAAR